MRILLLALGAALAAVPAASAVAADRASPETRLARDLEGRVAGEPVDCIDTSRFHSRIVDGTAIVFEGVGRTLYVNRPRGGQRSLDSWDILVTRQFASQLCEGDVVRLHDPSSFMQTGTVFLGEFVPYTRPRR